MTYVERGLILMVVTLLAVAAVCLVVHSWRCVLRPREGEELGRLEAWVAVSTILVPPAWLLGWVTA